MLVLSWGKRLLRTLSKGRKCDSIITLEQMAGRVLSGFKITLLSVNCVLKSYSFESKSRKSILQVYFVKLLAVLDK